MSSDARNGRLDVSPHLAEDLGMIVGMSSPLPSTLTFSHMHPIVTFLIMERRRRNMLEAVHWNMEDDDDKAV